MPLFLVRLLSVRPRQHALLLIGTAVLFVIVGGAVFAATQHLPVTTGWYWAITTATTVGYGDVTPKNASGRFVASVVMLTTIPLLAGAFALVTGSTVARGMRRLLDMGTRLPEGSYVLVLGMHLRYPSCWRSWNLQATDEPPRLLSAVRREREELVLGVVHGSFVSLGVADDPEVRPGDLLLLVEPNGHLGHGRHERRAEQGVDGAGDVRDTVRSSDGAPSDGAA